MKNPRTLDSHSLVAEGAGILIEVYPSMFCVYAHFVNGECIYIGKGNWKRPYGFNGRKTVWGNNVLKDGNQLIVKVLKWFSYEKDALLFEKVLIKDIKPICNLMHTDRGVPKMKGRIPWNKGRQGPPSPMKDKKFNHSEEVRARMRAAKIDKPLTREHKEKISKTLTGRPKSDEARLNMSASQKDRYVSPEARKKISEKLSGRKLSKEQCDQRSESMLKVWAIRKKEKENV